MPMSPGALSVSLKCILKVLKRFLWLKIIFVALQSFIKSFSRKNCKLSDPLLKKSLRKDRMQVMTYLTERRVRELLVFFTVRR